MLHWQLDCQTESQADTYRFVWFHTSSKARFLITLGRDCRFLA